jgi:hypothetical protein
MDFLADFGLTRFDRVSDDNWHEWCVMDVCNGDEELIGS